MAADGRGTPSPAPPLPESTPLTEPYWAAAREGRLVLQRCARCEMYRFPPEPGCAHCGSAEFSWLAVSGRGRVFSWTIIHPPTLPYFAARVPFAVAVVELDEGPRLVTSIVDLDQSALEFDLPVEVAFQELPGGLTLPVFRVVAR